MGQEFAKIPTFQSEDEERTFWATHDSADYLNWDAAEDIVLPKLHQQLERLAHGEGVSMNQYVVYALTRQVGVLHDLVATTPAERQAERLRWEELRQRLGQPAAADAVAAALASREPVEPEPDMSSAARNLIRRLESDQVNAAAG